ncbi:uncharacterized protein LOC119025077 isoform X2 [Acanthopagrus latus]|uniref:uncharacterized protein LOC119025077 isoform X2 n=1 Tax=Acanthopagrus latus TaxID=8177 RepID=UPI00187CEFFE|nr:uncharacterized protein LOC119025077 isoform X2 [Acanthopagrus latus]
MKPLNVRGRVGESVEVRCSEWGRWSNVKYNDKYLCKSPCTEDKHVIIKAAYEKSNSTGQIQLINIADGLFVNFTNLQKSDSGIYYCGAEKIGLDSFIKVNLKVTDAESSGPKTTAKTIIIHSTQSFAVTNSSTMSSDGSDVITDTPVPYTIHSTMTTTSATQGAGSVPYLITGATVTLTILMLLLMLMRKMRKKHLKVEDARELFWHPLRAATMTT